MVTAHRLVANWDLERKVTACHFSSSTDSWDRTAPVAKLELLASMWKGLVESEEIRTGAAVMLYFNLSKADRLAPPQCHPASLRVKSKSSHCG